MFVAITVLMQIKYLQNGQVVVFVLSFVPLVAAWTLWEVGRHFYYEIAQQLEQPRNQH
jgi:hypothetical protein